MGNTSNQPNPGPQPEKLQQFSLPQYGGKVLVDKIKRIVHRDFTIHEHEQEEFLKILKKRCTLKHPNLIQIIHWQEIEGQERDFCTPSFKRFRVTYPLYAYTLFNQIQNCCKVRRPLPQKEVCRIFEEVVSCLVYIHSQKTIHGDVKVGSIFMDRQRNVKLMDSFFLKQGKTAYEVVLQDPKSMSLLAPQQLDLLKVKIFDTIQQVSQREIFMVGLSMVQTTTIQEGMKCYDLESLKIRDQFFVYMMEQIQSCGYSYPLSNLIMNCVHKNPKSRPNFQQFLQVIKEIRHMRR